MYIRALQFIYAFTQSYVAYINSCRCARDTRILYSGLLARESEALESSGTSTRLLIRIKINTSIGVTLSNTLRFLKKIALKRGLLPLHVFFSSNRRLKLTTLIFRRRSRVRGLASRRDVLMRVRFLLSELSTRAASRRKTSSSTDPSYTVTRYNL